MLDAVLSQSAETMLLPDHQAERASVRRAILEAVDTVAALIATTGATIRGTELPLAGTIGAATVEGRADLVLADPDHVIDFKWGASTSRERLRAGAAVQLAIYSELARRGAAELGAAYLILRSRELLAAAGTELRGADVPGRHTVRDMLGGATSALGARVAELAMGALVAPSAREAAPRSQLAVGVLRLAPRCEYCALDGQCGRRGRA